MKKLRTILLMGLAAVIAVSSAIGGTLAYLTDTESAVNVMTVGNVDINQYEYQRAEGVAHKNTPESPAKEGDLVPYVQEQMLLPAVPSGNLPYTAEQSELFYWGYYTGGNGGNGLWDDSKLKNVIDKMVFVENKGNTNAYFRTLIAFECPEKLTVGDAGTGDDIGLNVNSGYKASSEACYIAIDGVRYDVRCFTYGDWNDGILSPGETARPSLLQIVLNHKATNEDVALFGEKYDVHVLSQAVQADGFADAETALNEAFGAFDVNNVAEWFGGEEYINTWDGTADISWYNDVDTEFTLTTAEQLSGLALLTGTKDQFEGKTIILGKNINLKLQDGAKSAFGNSFAPIGSTGERDSSNRLITESFKGTFDGKGHTISNLYQSGWDLGYEWQKYGSIGLFSELEGATVKNVVLEGFEGQVEGGDIAFVAGSATGNCVFENIEIKNGKIGTYNNGIGSIIGWSGEGNYTFKNINIASDVVLGGLWGSFDSSIGGVVGQGEPGATYNFEDVNIACRLDAYNDVTASYDYYNYRMCGMIIGRLAETTNIDGVNYPDTSKYNIICNNVTVTYGDWANYHYCRKSGARGIRVEPGFTYDGIAADYDHSVCTGHHMELIEFDQIFGGDQYGVKGLKTYDGVTVVYNNK